MNLDISKVKIAMINANLLTVEALGKKWDVPSRTWA